MVTYLIGTILKFGTVRKHFPGGIYSRITNLSNEDDGIVAVIPFTHCARNEDEIPVGLILPYPCYFNEDGNLWCTNISVAKTKEHIDKMFSIDSKITHITIF